MRARRLSCAVLGAALLVQTPTFAAGDDDVTALSGLTVMARRATTVSGVDVQAKLCAKALDPADPDRKPPRLVSTFPAKGAQVRPGLLILRLTFDQPMTCDGVLQNKGTNPCPPPLKSPMISRDRRTFLTVCKVTSGEPYGLVLKGFTSLAGHPLEPYELQFFTSDFAKVTSIQEAIDEDRELRNPAPPKS